MDFTYTPAEEAFRREFRTWLEPNLRPPRAMGRMRTNLRSIRAALRAWPGTNSCTTGVG